MYLVNKNQTCKKKFLSLINNLEKIKQEKISIQQQIEIEIDNFESEKNDLIAQINNLEKNF